MLIIVDLIRQNDEHGTTNEPAIQALCDSGRVKEVWLAASSSAIQYVERYPYIRLVKVGVNASASYRWLYSTWLTLKLLLANKCGGQGVLFLSATPLHYLLICFASRFFRSWGQKFFVIMHGELGYLIQPVGFGQKLGAWFIQTSFQWVRHCELMYIAIGYPIYKQLEYRFQTLQKHLAYIETPSSELPRLPQMDSVERDVRLGAFGVQSRDKNSSKIYELAKLLSNQSRDGYQLFTIGLAAQDFAYDQHPDVQHLCRGYLGKDYVPRQPFVETVKSLDWALFFYDHNQKYGLTPSGVFADCVNFCIPMVAMRSRVFELYFDRYGALGILCDSVEEMSSVVSDIVHGICQRAEFERNLRKASEDMSFAHFRSKLLEIVS